MNKEIKKIQNETVVAIAPVNDATKNYGLTELENHIHYLNNLVLSDMDFIYLGETENARKYFENYDSDTDDINVMTDYINKLEGIFKKHKVDFVPLNYDEEYANTPKTYREKTIVEYYDLVRKKKLKYYRVF